MPGFIRVTTVALAIACGVFATVTVRAADDASAQRQLDALVASYPDHLQSHDGKALIWRDGTRMPFDDGHGAKDFDTAIKTPSLRDQFRDAYALGRPAGPPAMNGDPGRIRYEPFFAKMYGDCRRGEVARQLVPIIWLPKRWGKRVMVTKVNGVDGKLQAVSDELDRLPEKFLRFLKPARQADQKYVPGVYNCRCIRGTQRASVHAYGAAIDLAFDHYWQVGFKPGGQSFRGSTDCNDRQPAFGHRHDGQHAHSHPYKNSMPMEIVKIFEKHGFIWGGKWHHYDTMHFEYRPELILLAR